MMSNQFENVFSARSLWMHAIICVALGILKCNLCIIFGILKILSSEVASFSSEILDTLIAYL